MCGRKLGDLQSDEPESQFRLLLEEQDRCGDWGECGWGDGCKWFSCFGGWNVSMNLVDEGVVLRGSSDIKMGCIGMVFGRISY
jgi:hypothetical protein